MITMINASRKYANKISKDEQENTDQSIVGSFEDSRSEVSENDSSFSEQESNYIEQKNSVEVCKSATDPKSNPKNCIVCANGDMPTGLHKCVSCSKNIHIINGWSHPIGDSEGCGEKRECISCYNRETDSKKKKAVKSQTLKPTRKNVQMQNKTDQKIAELNYVESWRKKTIKKSKYMKPVPNWDLVEIHKKVKIGHLKNGNLLKTVYKVNGKKSMLQNTCAFDCLVQMIAAGYAYNPSYRSYIDETDNPIFKLAKSIASK